VDIKGKRVLAERRSDEILQGKNMLSLSPSLTFAFWKERWSRVI
jgi:hypothetical protein